MSSIAKFCALVLLAGCAHASEPGVHKEQSRGTAHYTITIDDNFRSARVRVCVEGVALRALIPIDDSATRELRGAWIDGKRTDTSKGRIELPAASQSSCVTYEAHLRRDWLQNDDAHALIVSQVPWLWRPEPFPSELDATVRFVLPAGAEVSLPWPEHNGVHHPSRSAFFTSGYAVFGSFDRLALSVAGTRLDVAILGDRPSADAIGRWLVNAVATAASVGERFPRDRLHFIIAPVQSRDDSAVFGMVRRGGGISVLLIPSARATPEGLEADWVAVHELAHLWLPRMVSEDRWLSEGIATYLQEVLRARCGSQSSERAWKRLREGFDRGRSAGTGRSLAAESERMNQTGAYHRVYWAGAAFALETDVRLRQSSDGEMTLLRAIDLAHAHWHDTRPVRARDLLEALENASGARFIRELGERYATSSDFPGAPYAESADYREVRSQITSRVDGACAVTDESSR